jgi:transmembrane sensor
MTHEPIETAALDWVVRQRDPAFEAWKEFAQWLDEDPGHGDAYYALAALDADLADLPAETAAPAEPEQVGTVIPFAPRRVSRRMWLTGALAASLVGVVSVGLMQRAPGNYRIETAMGETHVVTLKDGSKIAVNGGSSVLLSRDDPRRATLERGQALFTVVHRDDAPFRVAVGKAELVDVGTVFDVTRTGGQTVVAVSEGAVVYNPGADNVRIDAGRRLAVRDGGTAELRAISHEAVGGWQGGQLVYDGVPLGDVAAEVGRTTGISIRTAPGASAILFRGALQTGGEPSRLVNDLAALSGTRATQDAGGWTLAK